MALTKGTRVLLGMSNAIRKPITGIYDKSFKAEDGETMHKVTFDESSGYSRGGTNYIMCRDEEVKELTFAFIAIGNMVYHIDCDSSHVLVATTGAENNWSSTKSEKQAVMLAERFNSTTAQWQQEFLRTE